MMDKDAQKQWISKMRYDKTYDINMHSNFLTDSQLSLPEMARNKNITKKNKNRNSIVGLRYFVNGIALL